MQKFTLAQFDSLTTLAEKVEFLRALQQHFSSAAEFARKNGLQEAPKEAYAIKANKAFNFYKKRIQKVEDGITLSQLLSFLEDIRQGFISPLLLKDTFNRLLPEALLDPYHRDYRPLWSEFFLHVDLPNLLGKVPPLAFLTAFHIHYFGSNLHAEKRHFTSQLLKKALPFSTKEMIAVIETLLDDEMSLDEYQEKGVKYLALVVLQHIANTPAMLQEIKAQRGELLTVFVDKIDFFGKEFSNIYFQDESDSLIFSDFLLKVKEQVYSGEMLEKLSLTLFKKHLNRDHTQNCHYIVKNIHNLSENNQRVILDEICTHLNDSMKDAQIADLFKVSNSLLVLARDKTLLSKEKTALKSIYDNLNTYLKEKYIGLANSLFPETQLEKIHSSSINIKTLQEAPFYINPKDSYKAFLNYIENMEELTSHFSITEMPDWFGKLKMIGLNLVDFVNTYSKELEEANHKKNLERKAKRQAVLAEYEMLKESLLQSVEYY